MVREGAEKAEGLEIRVEEAIEKIRESSCRTEDNACPQQSQSAEEQDSGQKEEQEQTGCRRLAEIKIICGKLAGLCDHVKEVQKRLASAAPSEALADMECEETEGRCKADVLLENCPLRKMAECNDIYNTCGAENCPQFEEMTICPFVDKEKVARCNYNFRLYRSGKRGNHSKAVNAEDRVCGEYQRVSRWSGTTMLPPSVKDCNNARPIPEEDEIKLSCRPTILRGGGKTVVNSSGFGIRFYSSGGTIKRAPHEGIDISGTGLIHSVADGVIDFAGKVGGGGWTIRIRHSNKENNPGSSPAFYSEYMHMSYPPEAGMKYLKGDPIGLKGTYGPIVKTLFQGQVLCCEQSCNQKGFYNLAIANVDGLRMFAALNGSYILDGYDSYRIPKGVWEDFGDEVVTYYKKGEKGKTVQIHFVGVWVPYMRNIDPEHMEVKAGQVIGLESGTSGESRSARYGSHLHFGLYKEVRGNSRIYLNSYKVLWGSAGDPPGPF